MAFLQYGLDFFLHLFNIGQIKQNVVLQLVRIGKINRATPTGFPVFPFWPCCVIAEDMDIEHVKLVLENCTYCN